MLIIGSWIRSSDRSCCSARRPVGRGLQGSRARPSAARINARAALMEQTKIFTALKGVADVPVDLSARGPPVRFSALVAEQRWIKEIDINLIAARQLIALDARVGSTVKSLDQIPKAAIPYPTLRGAVDDEGRRCRRIRHRPDEPCVVKFHETLSERTVYLRCFHLMNCAAHVRASHADLLHRLRPRNGAGGRRRNRRPASEILGVDG